MSMQLVWEEKVVAKSTSRAESTSQMPWTIYRLLSLQKGMEKSQKVCCSNMTLPGDAVRLNSFNFYLTHPSREQFDHGCARKPMSKILPVSQKIVTIILPAERGLNP